MTTPDYAAERTCYELAAKINDDGAPVYLTLLKCWKSATEAAAKKCEAEKVSAELRRFNANDLVHNTACEYCAAAIRGKGG